MGDAQSLRPRVSPERHAASRQAPYVPETEFFARHAAGHLHGRSKTLQAQQSGRNRTPKAVAAACPRPPEASEISEPSDLRSVDGVRKAEFRF
jgi:hypothetical protein